MSEAARPYKVWNYDRSVKKSITASTLQELTEKGCAKLNLSSPEQLRIVLEEDGTEVDEEDYFAFLPANSVLMILVNNEKWTSSQKDVSGRDETDFTALDDQTILFAQELKQDLSRVVTFTTEQLQQLVDCDTAELAQVLGETQRFARSVQDACQRHLDERSQTTEAIDLLKLYHKAQQVVGDSGSEGNVEKRRKLDL